MAASFPLLCRLSGKAGPQRISLRIFGIPLLLLFGVVTHAAGLDWPAKVIELRVDPAGKTAVVVFPCQNPGNKPVVITSVIPSCDCLKPKLSKEFFAPGESGELRVELTPAGRTGRSENTLTVITDDAAQVPVVLKLIINLAEPVVLSARSVFWQVGEPASEKLIELTLADPDKSTLDGVQCAEAAFVVRKETGEAPGKYRILIRPAATTSVAQTAIRLATTLNGQSHVLILQAGVR